MLNTNNQSSNFQYNDFIARFQQFASNFQGDPRSKVQELLNSGNMSQEQFNRLRDTANMLTGMHI